MKSTLLTLLPFLGLATALPLIHARDIDVTDVNSNDTTTVTMDPSITLPQAAAMGRIEIIETTNNVAIDAPGDPINENGLSGACKAVTVLFAKGTGEEGNMGDGSSPGPAWVAAIRASLGTAKVTVQGIAYDASILG